MTKYRYRVQGTHYIPEIKVEERDWTTIKAEGLGRSLQNLAFTLAELSPKTAGRTGNAAYTYENTGEVFFAEKYLVMAFLGALQALCEAEIKEVTI